MGGIGAHHGVIHPSSESVGVSDDNSTPLGPLFTPPPLVRRPVSIISATNPAITPGLGYQCEWCADGVLWPPRLLLFLCFGAVQDSCTGLAPWKATASQYNHWSVLTAFDAWDPNPADLFLCRMDCPPQLYPRRLIQSRWTPPSAPPETIDDSSFTMSRFRPAFTDRIVISEIRRARFPNLLFRLYTTEHGLVV